MRRARLGVLGLMLLAGCAPMPAQPGALRFVMDGGVTDADPQFVDASGQIYSLQSLGAQSLIVRYRPGVRGARVPAGGIRTLALPNGAEVFRFDSPAVAAAALKALLGDLDVELAEPDAPMAVHGAIGAMPTDAFIASQTYLAEAEADATGAWLTEAGDPAASYVAVIDSGVDAAHPDLTPNLVTGVTDLNFMAATATSANGDTLGHGTNVAGVLAAAANGSGIVGVAPQARVLALKVTDTASFNTSAVIRALYSAADNPDVGVINLSLGGTTDLATLREAIDYATWKGKVVVAAAGNSATKNRTFPASYEGVLSVGASRPVGGLLYKASFSNFGPWVGIVAPGQSLLTTLRGGGYGPISGTSVAAPIVSGAAVLLRTLHPTWTADQVRNHLREQGGAFASDFLAPGTRHLNLRRAVEATTPPTDAGPSVVTGSVRIVPAANAFNEVNISWRLDKEPISPQINASAPVGATDLVASSLSSDADCLVATGTISTLPTVSLRGLRHGTRYNFVIKGVDEGGNQPANTSVVYSFTTKALSIEGPQFTSSVYTPVLRWRTNAPTDHTVYFSPNADMSASTSIVNARLDSQHAVAMPRLLPNTVYHYRVVCTDANGNQATTSLTNRTLPITVSAPVINSGPSGHHVTWTSNVPTTGELWWGDLGGVAATATCDPAATCTVATNSLDVATVHSVRLDVPRAAIYVKPVVRDDAATQAIVHGTPTATRGPALKVLEFAASEVTDTATLLTWRTDRAVVADVAATTSASVAPASAAYVAATPAQGTLFRASLSGLTAGRTYYAYLRLTPVAPDGSLGTPVIVRPGTFTTRP